MIRGSTPLSIRVLLVLAASWFAYRCLLVPWISDTKDLIALYSGLRASWTGGSPYSLADVIAAAKAAGITYPYAIANVQWPLFFILLEPLGALPYVAFKSVWFVSSLGCVAILFRKALTHWRPEQRPVVAILLLIFAPIHTAFGTGQIVMWQAAALLVALRFLVRQDGARSAIAFAVTTVLKPQNAATIVPAALLLKGRALWIGLGAFLLALATVSVLDGAGIVTRFTDWTQLALAHAGLAGGASGGRPDFMNVSLPEALRFLGAGGLTWLLYAGALGALIAIHRPSPRRESGDVEMLALVSFMVGYAAIYHRYYDLALLLAFSGAYPAIWRAVKGSRVITALLVIAIAFNWQAVCGRAATIAGIEPATLQGVRALAFSAINWAQTIVLLAAAFAIYHAPTLKAETLRRLMRFGSVGVFGAATYYLLLAILISLLNVPVMIATSIAFPLVAFEMYLLHRKWTFRSTRSHSTTLPLFIGMTAAGALINWSVMYAGVHMLQLNYLVAQTLAIGAVVVWNFTCSQLWVFRPALNAVPRAAE